MQEQVRVNNFPCTARRHSIAALTGKSPTLRKDGHVSLVVRMHLINVTRAEVLFTRKPQQC